MKATVRIGATVMVSWFLASLLSMAYVFAASAALAVLRLGSLDAIATWAMIVFWSAFALFLFCFRSALLRPEPRTPNLELIQSDHEKAHNPS